jgi:hypothetical protein
MKIYLMLAALVAAAPLAACTHDDWIAVADGLNMAADDMAVTLTRVPPFGCGFNANRDPVCDDTGDGFANRYADPAYDYIPGWTYSRPPLRINDYGEAYQYDAGCDCWRREPSLDTYPR